MLDQICRALGAAHEQNIVHRDLKPENIFLVLERRAPPFIKLLDFGLAKLLGDQSDGRKDLTRPGAVYGTPAYMSPEQCMAAGKVDPLTDIYSLGVIVFEMICGRVPYPFIESEGVGMLMVKHMTAPIPVCSEVASDRSIPPALDAFFAKALAKKKEDRHPNCEAFYDEFIESIGALRSEESISTPSPATETATLPPPLIDEQKLEEDDATDFYPTQISPIPEAPSAPEPAPQSQAPQTHAWPQDQPPPEEEPGEEKSNTPIIAIGVVSLIAAASVALLLWPSPPPTTPKPGPASLVSAPLQATSVSLPVSAPAKVMLHVSSLPKGAKVYLGERLLGLTPLSKEIPGGDAEVRLRIEKLGFEAVVSTFIPNGEHKEDVKLNLIKAGTPPKNNNNPKIETPPKDGSKITINPFNQKK